MGITLGIIGIFLAVGVAGAASAVGLKTAGSTATAAMIEDPKQFGRYLVLTVLPGTQGIYGFVVGFLAIAKLTPNISVAGGLSLLFACAVTAFTAWTSATNQGRVCAGGIEMTLKHPEESGKALVLAVLIEFYSILGFVMSIMLLNGNFFS